MLRVMEYGTVCVAFRLAIGGPPPKVVQHLAWRARPGGVAHVLRGEHGRHRLSFVDDPALAKLRPILVEFGQTMAELGRTYVDIGPNLATSMPAAVDVPQADSRQSHPQVGQHRFSLVAAVASSRERGDAGLAQGGGSLRVSNQDTYARRGVQQ